MDALMVGRLGPRALAGVVLGNTVFFTVRAVTSGVVHAVEPTVAQARRRGRRPSVA